MTIGINVTDTAKEIARIATTAGLSKDVIDLLEKKLALLIEENTALATKVSRLEIENGQLRAQLQNSQPTTSGFHSALGVLWKRDGKGFERVPYCPKCKTIMLGQPPLGPMIDPQFWQCAVCNLHATFSGRPK